MFVDNASFLKVKNRHFVFVPPELLYPEIKVVNIQLIERHHDLPKTQLKIMYRT